MIYRPFSERSILVEWPQKIDLNVLFDVINFKETIQNSYIKEVLQVNNTYNSILIIYEFTIDNFYNKISILKSLNSSRIPLEIGSFHQWKIPVCYDDTFALDLDEISEQKQTSKSQIISWHSEPVYTVFFIGFLPGFMYLGGLDKRLHFPRKQQPRSRVEKGAVAIGNSQTGIYPNASPAGWNVIGNSPLQFFNPLKNPPCFVKTGDQIKFVPVSLEHYQEIKSKVTDETYQIESEVIRG